MKELIYKEDAQRERDRKRRRGKKERNRTKRRQVGRCTAVSISSSSGPVYSFGAESPLPAATTYKGTRTTVEGYENRPNSDFFFLPGKEFAISGRITVYSGGKVGGGVQ